MIINPKQVQEEKDNVYTNSFSVLDCIETIEVLANQLKKAHDLLNEIGREYHGWKDIEDYFDDCNHITKEWTE